MVVHGDAVAAQGVDFKAVRLYKPFAPNYIVFTAHHAIVIIDVSAFLQVELQVACPLAAVGCPHTVRRRLHGLAAPACYQIEYKFLAETRAVNDVQ